MYEVPPMVEFRISQWFSFSVAIFFQLTSVRTSEIQQLVEKSNNDNRKRINTVKVFRKWGKKFFLFSQKKKKRKEIPRDSKSESKAGLNSLASPACCSGQRLMRDVYRMKKVGRGREKVLTRGIVRFIVRNEMGI